MAMGLRCLLHGALLTASSISGHGNYVLVLGYSYNCVLRAALANSTDAYAVNQTMDGSLSVGTGFTI
jgi:hypothetical protein